jgi:TDG/mug DNA glycosylase family protein
VGAVPKTTPDELAAAYGGTIADVVAPGLRVLFVGINPSLYSAATGHHFARPGNRFWPALHRAGLTSWQFCPSEQTELLANGLGVTNLVGRATATAAELSRDELRAGGEVLRLKVAALTPSTIAFLGVTTYRSAYGAPRAMVGEQPTLLEGARVWVLPNPSGLNAHYQLPDLARLYAELRAS